MTKSEELQTCLDKCCQRFPVVQIGIRIVIYCAICGDGIEVDGTNPQSELNAMLQWNHKKRN